MIKKTIDKRGLNKAGLNKAPKTGSSKLGGKYRPAEAGTSTQTDALVRARIEKAADKTSVARRDERTNTAPQAATSTLAGLATRTIKPSKKAGKIKKSKITQAVRAVAASRATL